MAVLTLLAPREHAAVPAATPDAAEEWVPINTDDLMIKAGTALDFSALRGPAEPAGRHGFTTVNARGQWVFEGQPDVPLRLFCAPLALREFPYETPEELAKLADQIARAGYNSVRLHWLDLFLMYKAPGDLQFNPQRLDIVFRLLAELKSRGIYATLDATTSDSMFHAIQTKNEHNLGHQMKSAVYHSPEARKHWEQGVSALFNAVNPYTGLALKDDPQIVFVVPRNEPNIGFLVRPQSRHRDGVIAGLLPGFRTWLQQRHGSLDALGKAWGMSPRTWTGFDDVAWPESASTAAYADLLAYVTAIEQETYRWEADYLRNTVGVQVPIVDYNVGGSLQSLLAKSIMPMIDTHSYHDHPRGFSLGASMHMRGLIEMGVPTVGILSGRRFLDKPFIVSEWGVPFYNAARHEAGMVIGAYAALQGWQMIGQHALPVGLAQEKPIGFFRVFRDPALRAADRMAALLFGRGDVRESPNAVVVDLGTPAQLEASPLFGNALPSDLTRLSLVCKLGIAIKGANGAQQPVEPVMRVTPTKGATVTSTIGSEASFDVPDDGVTASLLARLKQSQALPDSNATDVAAGTYESDTRELKLITGRRFLSVDTPRSQGAALAAKGDKVSLASLSLTNQGCPLAVLVGSLDGRPLASSNHMLAIVATDARNSDMQFEKTADGWLKVLDFGKLPVRVRPAHFVLGLRGREAGRFEAWALTATGERADRLPVTESPEGLQLEVDMKVLAGGPSNYVEIVGKAD